MSVHQLCRVVQLPLITKMSNVPFYTKRCNSWIHWLTSVGGQTMKVGPWGSAALSSLAENTSLIWLHYSQCVSTYQPNQDIPSLWQMSISRILACIWWPGAFCRHLHHPSSTLTCFGTSVLAICECPQASAIAGKSPHHWMTNQLATACPLASRLCLLPRDQANQAFPVILSCVQGQAYKKDLIHLLWNTGWVPAVDSALQ